MPSSRRSKTLGWLLTGDAGQRVIAAWHFGWGPAIQASGKELGTAWIVPRLAHVLDDPYPAVRWVGWQSLKALPGVTKFDYDFDGTAEHRRMVIRKLLGSPGRAVPGWSPDPKKQIFGNFLYKMLRNTSWTAQNHPKTM